MSTETELQQRSGSKCELCNATDNLSCYEVPPTSDGSADECVFVCQTCREQIENPDKVDVNHCAALMTAGGARSLLFRS